MAYTSIHTVIVRSKTIGSQCADLRTRYHRTTCGVLQLSSRLRMMGRWCSVKSGQTKATENDQHRRFIETARQLECDEDNERFEEKLKRIATARPAASRKADER
jgi:hypothetical protein